MEIDRTDAPATGEYATVYIALELSKAQWRLGMLLPGERNISCYAIAGGDLAALSKRLDAAEVRASRGGRPVRIVSCYEAGYDGHWLHRWLVARGVINHEIDPASLEVNRRARQAKTDRIDVERLLGALLRHERGDPRACSVVRVPTPEQEDTRRRSRERDRLKKERGAHSARIKSLLHAQGIRDVQPLRVGFVAALNKMRTGDGRPLGAKLKEEIRREHARLCLADKHLRQLEAASHSELRTAAPGSNEAKIVALAELRGIGMAGAQKLVNEVFYRLFEDRRQVGGYFGLAGTPYDSGRTRREQGISKAGNACARAAAIESSWLWLTHQPESDLSIWYRSRVGDHKGRIRRIMIVALARKLMIALWRYLETGVIPAGAKFGCPAV
jgi:transposase